MNFTMVQYGCKGPVESLLQHHSDGDVTGISSQNDIFTKIGYLQDRRLAQGLLELVKSPGMFLSPHNGNPLPFESMKDVSELAKSRYKAGVESVHPEISAQRAEIVRTRILIDGLHAVR